MNKKTGGEKELLVGKCMVCNKKKSMIVSDNTFQAERLGDFFKNLGKKGLNKSKNMAENLLKNPSRALDISANIATAAASRNPINVMSTLPDLITFYNTGRSQYLPQFDQIMLYKWSKKS